MWVNRTLKKKRFRKIAPRCLVSVFGKRARIKQGSFRTNRLVNSPTLMLTDWAPFKV